MADYIDRELALSHPFANGKYDHENADEHFVLGHESYKEWLKQLPAADVVPVKHGHWEFEYENIMDEIEYACSVCDWIGVNADEYNYCPQCGAKMDE